MLDAGCPQSTAELKRHYADVRRRLNTPPPRPKVEPPPPAKPALVPPYIAVPWKFVVPVNVAFPKTGQRLTLDAIMAAVAREYGVPQSEIRGQRRGKRAVVARQTFYWLAKRLTPHSLPNIGRACGGRDHTTIMHGCRQVDGWIAADAPMAVCVRAVEAHLCEAFELRKSAPPMTPVAASMGDGEPVTASAEWLK